MANAENERKQKIAIAKAKIARLKDRQAGAGVKKAWEKENAKFDATPFPFKLGYLFQPRSLTGDPKGVAKAKSKQVKATQKISDRSRTLGRMEAAEARRKKALPKMKEYKSEIRKKPLPKMKEYKSEK